MGEHKRTISIVATWVYNHKVSLHLGPNKTVMQVIGCSAAIACAMSGTPPMYLANGEFLPKPITLVRVHRWLGLQWRADGDWMQHAQWCVAVCSAMMGMLVALLENGSVPMAIVHHQS